MKKTLLVVLFFILAWIKPAFAQKESREDRVEAYKIAFITEKLNLTPREAAAFWPVYNEYSDKLVSLRNKEYARVKLFNHESNPTDAEAEVFIKEYLAYKEQMTELTQTYVVEFKKVLPLAKVAKLVTLEQEFKMQLLQHYKEKKAAPAVTH
jgi:hypothetical protein